MIISVTTHGKRTPLVGRILSAILRNSDGTGAKVALTVHSSDRSLLSEDVVSMVSSGSVELLVSDTDYGSNLKYLVAMQRHPDEPVMVHDDDVVFPKEAYRELDEWTRSRPGTIGCRRIRIMRWDDAGIPAKFPKGYRIVSSDSITAPMHVLDSFPEGCKGVVFPAGCFTDLLSDPGVLEEIRTRCFHDDDVALRVLAVRKNLATWLVPTKRLVETDYYASKREVASGDPNFVREDLIVETSLWSEGNGGERTTACLRSYGKELWDGRASGSPTSDVLYVVGPGRNPDLLRWSLRSLEKYASAIGRVVVAGYPPDWLSDSVTKVPCENDSGRWCKHHQIMKCVLRAIDESAVSGRFMYSSDDHFMLKYVHLPSYPVWVRSEHMPSMDGYAAHGKVPNRWARSCMHTRDLLLRNGYGDVRFSCHLNTWMHAESADAVKELVRQSEAEGSELGLEPTDAFMNVWLRDHDVRARRVSDMKAKTFTTWDELMRTVGDRVSFSVGPKVLADPEFAKAMNGLFPDKSRYEI